jgi:3-oxoacyl-[acyl-carrier-protein] synthase II
MWFVGIGAVTGYGWSREDLWRGLASGISAAQPVGGFGPELGDVVTVATIPDKGDPADGPRIYPQALRAAAREAVHDARARGWSPSGPVGVVHATVQGDVAGFRALYRGEVSGRRAFAGMMPSTSLSLMVKEFGWNGPVMTASAMCASGNAALITAQGWIMAGIVKDVLVIMADVSVVPEALRGFLNLGVAVTDAPALRACRPFQEGSRGFVMGEAAAAFIVSADGTGAYGQLLGGAMTHDAHHVISIEPTHEQVKGCVATALDNAGVSGADISWLNAHGPGTKQCDSAEAAMAESVLGRQVGIFSIKPLVGHCQSAAGGVEVIASLLAYERGVLPAPVRVARGHSQLLPGPVECHGGLTVKTSLGMGGHNAAVVLAPSTTGPRWPDPAMTRTASTRSEASTGR